jgi:hypothetical protein
MIEGKNYGIIYRNESRYRRGDRLRRVDRGRHGSRVVKAEPAPESVSAFLILPC